MSAPAVIANPKCRANRRDPSGVERLARCVGDAGLFFATQDDAALESAALACRRQGVSLIAIHGGDGTLHVTLTKLAHVYDGDRLPPILFLRGGTQNTVADACGVRGEARDVLQNVLERLRAKHPLLQIERDILRVGPPPEHQRHAPLSERRDVYGFIFGNGFSYQFLDEYYRLGEPSRWNAFVTLFLGCCSVAVRGALAKRMFRRFRGRVTVDGSMWPASDFTGIVGSTIEQVGLGFRPFVRCDERPGTFHLLGIMAGAMGFAAELPAIRAGMPLNDQKILNGVYRNVVLEADEPLRYMLDGDLRDGATRLELGVGPRLRIVVPGPRELRKT